MSDNAMVPYSDVERMGAAIAKSGLFGMKTAEQAIALMLIAQAEGMHPALAARDFHVIQGRPALKADAMLARFQAQGGKVQWTDYTDTRVAATFSHPSGGTVSIDWTMDRAKAAGLTGKDNWKHYPRQMLRARVISEGIRTVFPGVAVGIYTPEEVQDFEPARSNGANGHAVIEAQAEPAKPENYETVMADLRAVADEGTSALKEGWMRVPVAIRSYATSRDKETWESIKAHAAQASAVVDVPA